MWGKRRNTMLQAGDHAPEFEMRNLQGEKTSLRETLSSSPTLLAFFKIGCPVCQFTLPFLERMAQNNSVQFIGVSQDDAEATQFFNKRFGVQFLTLLDEAQQGFPVSNAYGISSVPSLFLVETDGSISTAFNGFSKKDLEALGERVQVKPFRPDEKVPEFKAG